MTNLERNKERIRDGMPLCAFAYLCRYGERCSRKICSNCEFNENVDECIKEVLSEHKEPIKLKQWEKDLLEIIDYQETRFDFYTYLRDMKKRGYFEGVTDTNMGIKEILDNCEVID